MDKKEREAFVEAYSKFGANPRKCVELCIDYHFAEVAEFDYLAWLILMLTKNYQEVDGALSMWKDAVKFANNHKEN